MGEFDTKEEALDAAAAMEFRPLPDSYRTHGYDFSLHKRGNNAAWYKSEDGTHEVFLIRKKKPTAMKVAGTFRPIPEREILPSDEHFGSWAASFGKNAEDRAQETFDKMESGEYGKFELEEDV